MAENCSLPFFLTEILKFANIEYSIVLKLCFLLEKRKGVLYLDTGLDWFFLPNFSVQI